MVRTILTKDSAPGTNAAIGKVLTLTAWDASGDRFISTGKELVVAYNTHATVAKTVTVTSVADVFGRTGDVTAFSVPALSGNPVAVFGPFKSDGWMQSDGYVYIDAVDINVKFAVVVLP